MSVNEIEKQKDLMIKIRDSGRQLSGVTIQFHHLVSEKVGLSGADHKYLDLLLRHGSMTAGRMAELSGLTTGAITGVLDRLEKQNLISREKDPGDRRKVMVVPNVQLTMKKLGPVFQSLEKNLNESNKSFTSAQLRTIHEYMQNSISVFSRLIEELKKGSI